jgi:hypothetical protein
MLRALQEPNSFSISEQDDTLSATNLQNLRIGLNTATAHIARVMPTLFSNFSKSFFSIIEKPVHAAFCQ